MYQNLFCNHILSGSLLYSTVNLTVSSDPTIQDHRATRHKYRLLAALMHYYSLSMLIIMNGDHILTQPSHHWFYLNKSKMLMPSSTQVLPYIEQTDKPSNNIFTTLT